MHDENILFFHWLTSAYRPVKAWKVSVEGSFKIVTSYVGYMFIKLLYFDILAHISKCKSDC